METTNLLADVGRILCASILTHDGKMVTLRNDRIRGKAHPADDSEISRRIRDILEKHHVTVGWYSKGFDLPFLNTRLVQNRHRRLKSMLHLDPRWQMSGWRGLKPRNAKLATAAEFFGLKEQKMDVPVEVWARAATGNHAAMDILCERCESDVRLLEEVTELIMDAGFIKNISMYP